MTAVETNERKERNRAYSRKWRATHPGAMKASYDRWFERDPEHARQLKREAAARYRAKRKKEQRG